LPASLPFFADSAKAFGVLLAGDRCGRPLLYLRRHDRAARQADSKGVGFEDVYTKGGQRWEITTRLSNSNIAPNGMTDNPNPSNTNAAPGAGTCFSNTVASPQTVDAVDMYSPYPTPTPSPASFVASPCVEYSTILDYMASAAPTTSPYYQWQYIAKDTTSIWSAPMAVMHLYQDYSADPNPAKTGQPFAVDSDAENFVLNVTSSIAPTPNPRRPFAELTFITPCVGESDHPNTAAPGHESFDDGPDWLAYVLNAVGRSPYWESTAVIVTWDDWGGFYDISVRRRGPTTHRVTRIALHRPHMAAIRATRTSGDFACRCS
jgi:hypothetical protein